MPASRPSQTTRRHDNAVAAAGRRCDRSAARVIARPIAGQPETPAPRVVFVRDGSMRRRLAAGMAWRAHGETPVAGPMGPRIRRPRRSPERHRFRRWRSVAAQARMPAGPAAATAPARDRPRFRQHHGWQGARPVALRASAVRAQSGQACDATAAFALAATASNGHRRPNSGSRPNHEINDPQRKTVALQDRSVKVADQHRGALSTMPSASRSAHRTTRETGRARHDTTRSPARRPGSRSLR